MLQLKLPAPDELYGTLTSAIVSIKVVSAFITQYGPNLKLSDFANLAADPKLLLAVPGLHPAAFDRVVRYTSLTGGVIAAYYFGATLGSLAVATGKAFERTILVNREFYSADLAYKMCNAYEIPFHNALLDERFRPRYCSGRRQILPVEVR